jgi:hypothetical protein
MPSLHQVRNVGLNKISLYIWNFSCFCKFCIDGGDGPCDHLDYVPRFSLIRLVPCRPKDVKNKIKEDNCLISNDREMLVNILQSLLWKIISKVMTFGYLYVKKIWLWLTRSTRLISGGRKYTRENKL